MIGIGNELFNKEKIMKKIFYFAVAASMVMASCSNEDVVAPQNETFTINATIGKVDTRTAYTDLTADAEKGLKVEWEANEKISVIEVSDNKFTGNVYEFTSTNVAGATATFTAPAGFTKNDSYQYVAVYPALEKFEEGTYFGGTANNVATLQVKTDNNQYITSSMLTSGTNKAYQSTANDCSHLKNYDAMVSAVTFNGNVADINFIKLNAVIKWNLTLPEEAVTAGMKPYMFTIEGTSNTGMYYDAAISLSNIAEGKIYWGSGNRSEKLSMNLGNLTGSTSIDIPSDGKLSVYMPVFGTNSAYSYMQFFSKDATYSITVNCKGAAAYDEGADYTASISCTENKLIEQGKVYVIKATLEKIAE